jgi:uncharacterized membrane protein YbaN (DUF454 family)
LPHPGPARGSLGRAALLATGWVCFAAGWAGVFLPLVPGTPLLILSAACLGRSSPRAERWLLANRLVGPAILRWRATRTVDARVKAWGLLLVTASFASAAVLARAAWLRWTLVPLGAVLLVVLARVPTKPAARAG